MARSLVGKALQVSWMDAWQSGEYFSFEEAARMDGKVLESYGFCIGDTKKGLSLAMDDLRPAEDNRFRDVKFIPRAMVVKIKELR